MDRRQESSRKARGAGRRDKDLSARFSSDERQRVELAIARSGKTMSEFIREAVIGSAELALAEDPLAAFAGAIGAIDVQGSFGRRSDAVYAELLLAKHRKRASQPKEVPEKGLEG